MVVLGALPGCLLSSALSRRGRSRLQPAEPASAAEAGPCKVIEALVERDFVLRRRRVLGTGMSGSVVLAERNGAEFAVKRFRIDKLTVPALADLRREIEIHRELQHPHIARLEAFYSFNGEVSLVLERLLGGELFEHIMEHGRLDEATSAASLGQMLLAIDYLHRCDIVHCDVKPENFVYRDRARRHVCLIDFGLARKGSQRIKATCGTLDYMAPEVLRRDFHCKADMWSLGVVAYGMLCGATPWLDANLELQILAGCPRFSSTFAALSAEPQDFVRSLLQLKEDNRLSSSEALEHGWIARSFDGFQMQRLQFPKASAPGLRKSSAGSTAAGSASQGSLCSLDGIH